MGAVDAKHKTVGVELSQAEWEAAASHDLSSDGIEGEIVVVGAAGALESTADPVVDNLTVGENLSGNNTLSSLAYEEYAFLKMDDDAATPVVKDEAGHHPQTFLDPTGDPNTDAHSVAGVVGTALYFDGVDDYIDFGVDFAKELLAENQDFTVAVWFKFPVTVIASAVAVLSQYGDAVAADVGFRFRLSVPGTLTGSVLFSDGTAANATFAGANDDAWHHYVISRAGTTISMYLDGALDTTKTAAIQSEDLWDAAEPLYLGRGAIGGQGTSEVSVDDLRFYSRALSASQIEALYNGGSGTASPLKTVVAIDGVAAVERLAVAGEFTNDTYLLQLGGGAYATAVDFFPTSCRESKTEIVSVNSVAEWAMLDLIEVVEFNYRKRNKGFGKRWLDPDGNVVPSGSVEGKILRGDQESPAFVALVEQGYALDSRRFTDEPDGRRVMGFIAEDLQAVSPRLSRGDGISAMNVVAFAMAALQEAKKEIVALKADAVDLEARVSLLESS